MLTRDPMDTGIPATPAFQDWQGNMLMYIRARYPSLPDVVQGHMPWLEGYEDRYLQSVNDLAQWLVICGCMEAGVDEPPEIESAKE